MRLRLVSACKRRGRIVAARLRALSTRQRSIVCWFTCAVTLWILRTVYTHRFFHTYVAEVDCEFDAYGPTAEQLLHRDSVCTEQINQRCPAGVVHVLLACNCTPSGGPEAYHQLHAALGEAGHCTLMHGGLREYETRYSRHYYPPQGDLFHGVSYTPQGWIYLWRQPLGADLHSTETSLHAGDVVVLTDAMVEPPLMTEWIQRGVTVTTWNVGQTVADLVHGGARRSMAGSIPLCLDQYFRQMYRCFPSAQMAVPMTDVFQSEAALARSQPMKENLIIIDNDNDNNDVTLESVQSGLALVPGLPSDVKIVFLHGFTRAEVIDLYKRAKLVIDLYVPGAERIIFESVLFNCMVAVAVNGNAREITDFPIPAKARLPGFPSVKDVVGVVAEYLPRYDTAIDEWHAMRSVSLSMRRDTLVKRAKEIFLSVTFAALAHEVHEHETADEFKASWDMDEYVFFLLMHKAQFPLSTVALLPPNSYQLAFQNAALFAQLRAFGVAPYLFEIHGESHPAEPHQNHVFNMNTTMRETVCIATSSPLPVLWGQQFLEHVIEELRACKQSEAQSGIATVLDLGSGMFCMVNSTFQLARQLQMENKRFGNQEIWQSRDLASAVPLSPTWKCKGCGKSMHTMVFRPFRSGSGGGVRPYGQPAISEPSFFNALVNSAAWSSIEHTIPPKIQQLVKQHDMRTSDFANDLGVLPKNKGPYIVSHLVGGLNNQVLELMNLVAIARQLGAIVVLPEWSLTYNYFAKDFGESKRSAATHLRFSELYNVTSFSNLLLSFGIQAVSTLPAHLAPLDHKQLPVYPKLQLTNALGHYRTHLQSSPVLRVACAQQNYPWETPAGGRLRAGMLQALEVVPEVQAVVTQLIRIIRQKSGYYTALHLRIEKDWEKYCVDETRNPQISRVKRREQCFQTAEDLVTRLEHMQVSKVHPIYLAGGNVKESHMAVFKRHGFTVFSKNELLGRIPAGVNDAWSKLPCCLHQASLDMQICVHADLFVGNFYSSFSFVVKETRWTATLQSGATQQYVPRLSLWSNPDLLPQCTFSFCGDETARWDVQNTAYSNLAASQSWRKAYIGAITHISNNAPTSRDSAHGHVVVIRGSASALLVSFNASITVVINHAIIEVAKPGKDAEMPGPQTHAPWEVSFSLATILQQTATPQPHKLTISVFATLPQQEGAMKLELGGSPFVTSLRNMPPLIN